jgi:hypothetical protein
MTDVYLESGKTWTFAAAVEWPGWCRRGKGEEAALEELLAYADRYKRANPGFVLGELHVVGRLTGTGTTEFGAPDVEGPWDAEPPTHQELEALQSCWAACDTAVARASKELRKGPRGGGRDRDQVVDHVREAERAYGRKVGARVPPRTPWPEQRQAVLAALHDDGDTSWSRRYAVRRIAWHVLDHAWEVEDKSLR